VNEKVQILSKQRKKWKLKSNFLGKQRCWLTIHLTSANKFAFDLFSLCELKIFRVWLKAIFNINFKWVNFRTFLWAVSSLQKDFFSTCTDRPVYNNHPCDPQKVVVVQRWLVNGDFSIKIVINISLARLSHCWQVAVIQRWALTQVWL